MDRTIMVPYRAEEKKLSHILYNAIQALMLLHSPTEDLQKHISEEMFIKPNQQAFFHIMHYLFRLLDPQEFKKRFFWPITDKRAESNFRTSTVEYLKHLNEKHQLNWSNIKLYLVVMPGGMKFITFLLDFVHFITQKLIKQKERQLSLNSNSYRSEVSQANLWKMCKKNETLKDMVSEFIETLDTINTKCSYKTQKLIKQLETLSRETDLNVNLLTDDKFLKSFEEQNHRIFKQYYSERTKKVLEMESLIVEIKQAMDKFYSKETSYNYDKQQIYLQLRRIRDHFSMEDLVEESSGSKATDDGVNINSLISTFNTINETIQHELKFFNKIPSTGEFVCSRLLSLKNDLQEIETQITDFKKVIHANIKKSKSDLYQSPVRDTMREPTKQHLENTLLMKLVSTPPIKFEVPEGGFKSRLSLVDNKTPNTTGKFNSFLALPHISTIVQTNCKNSLVNQSMLDLNNTMSRLKLIDPMILLRSSSKKDISNYKTSKPQINISNLGTKWKQRQSLFKDNAIEVSSTSVITSIANTPKTHLNPLHIIKNSPKLVISTASPTKSYESPSSPFCSNDRTRINRSQYQLNTSEIDCGNNSASTSLNYIQRLSAVKRVQDASLNFANLSTSPSGRLEALVTVEDLNIPKLKLNDISLIDHNLTLNNSMIFEEPKVVVNTSVDYVNVNDENNPNTGNINKQNVLETNKKYKSEEDNLFNISDSVLKDVTL